MSKRRIDAVDYGYLEVEYGGGLGILFTASDETESAGGIFTAEQAREAARALFELADEMALQERSERS